MGVMISSSSEESTEIDGGRVVDLESCRPVRVGTTIVNSSSAFLGGLEGIFLEVTTLDFGGL
jgi:hypothetical protein